jgi:hypothetical protein
MSASVQITTALPPIAEVAEAGHDRLEKADTRRPLITQKRTLSKGSAKVA